MIFKEALELMKQGRKMKLPSWGGYWEWDFDKETILMHCRETDSETGKDVLDIRETQRVEYTIKNILSDEWTWATEENCILLGGTPTFDFGQAIKYLKRGLKVKRKGWNGKNQYVQLVADIWCTNSNCESVHPFHEDIGSKALCFFGSSGSQIGWLASQSDMLANDWTFAE